MIEKQKEKDSPKAPAATASVWIDIKKMSNMMESNRSRLFCQLNKMKNDTQRADMRDQ